MQVLAFFSAGMGTNFAVMWWGWERGGDGNTGCRTGWGWAEYVLGRVAI